MVRNHTILPLESSIGLVESHVFSLVRLVERYSSGLPPIIQFWCSRLGLETPKLVESMYDISSIYLIVGGQPCLTL